MKSSLIIPVYNEEHYIAQCLQAVFKQTEPFDEVLVIDNNCTDNTVQIAKQFPVKVIKEATQGMTPARNRGFNEAKGDILARCDADSIVPPDWNKKIKKRIAPKRVVGVAGPATIYDFSLPSEVTKQLVLANFAFLKTICNQEVLFGSNMAIKKNAWDKVKHEVCLDDSEVHEDIDLSLHILKYGEIIFDNDLVVAISGRRIQKHPFSTLEYPVRFFKSVYSHKLKPYIKSYTDQL